MDWKIYTKGGDKGTTGLLGGARVPKYHNRLEAYGTIDELNSFLGAIRSYSVDSEISKSIIIIQRQLFSIASYLAYDKDLATTKIENLPQIDDRQVVELELKIDKMNEELPELTNFIMPGGDPQSATCHIARTVCRRAERRVVVLSESVKIDSVIIRYLNRLSDYLFVLARYISKRNNTDEILWKNDV